MSEKIKSYSTAEQAIKNKKKLCASAKKSRERGEDLRVGSTGQQEVQLIRSQSNNQINKTAALHVT